MIVNSNDDKVYVVLGTGRSGTSFLSKCLSSYANMGANGHYLYEDMDFRRLNDFILKEAGGSFYNPPSMTAIDGVDVKGRVTKLLSKKKNNYWGWKDPRTLYTLKHYLPYLEGDVYLMVAFRKPNRVVRSKQQFEPSLNMSRDEWYSLVMLQNKILMEQIKYFLGIV